VPAYTAPPTRSAVEGQVRLGPPTRSLNASLKESDPGPTTAVLVKQELALIACKRLYRPVTERDAAVTAQHRDSTQKIDSAFESSALPSPSTGPRSPRMDPESVNASRALLIKHSVPVPAYTAPPTRSAVDGDRSAELSHANKSFADRRVTGDPPCSSPRRRRADNNCFD
jgi:hypothetical protein